MTENIYNWYNAITAENKLDIRNQNYLTIITNMISSMFIIDGLTNAQTTALIRYAIYNGTAYIEKTDDNKYIIALCKYYDIPDITEIYPEKIIAYRDVWNYKGKIKENATVVMLTPDGLPLTIVNRFANILSEVDTSLNNNVQFCRIAPIISARTDKVKAEYKKCMETMLKGELYNTVTDIYSPSKDEPTGFKISNISDGNYSEKIQYLSMFHNELISRLAKLFGINYNFISKQANITKDELYNGEDFSAVYPILMLKTLNECLSKIGLKAKFNPVLIDVERIMKGKINENENTSDFTTNEPTAD